MNRNKSIGERGFIASDPTSASVRPPQLAMIYIAFLLLTVLTCIASEYIEPSHTGCAAVMIQDPGDESPTAHFQCVRLGFDGQSFSEVVGNWTAFGPDGRRLDFYGIKMRKQNETTADMLKTVRKIYITSIGRKVNFGEKPFALFPNLQSIEIWKTHEYPELVRRNWTPDVTIPADAFRQTPQLKRIVLNDIHLSESTIRALASVNDQLEEIIVHDVSPEDPIMRVLANFTKLRTLHVRGMCVDRDFPTEIFEKSAPTFDLICIVECFFPKITKNLFSSMPNLKILRWVESNITEIEQGSFDANPKLLWLTMSNNTIRTLPDGLFSKLMKLTLVSFRGNELIGLSRSNFSHVEKYNSSFTYWN